MGTRMSGLNGPAAFFLFFLWVGVVQVVLALIHRKLVLDKGELLTIYIMMVVSHGVLRWRTQRVLHDAVGIRGRGYPTWPVRKTTGRNGSIPTWRSGWSRRTSWGSGGFTRAYRRGESIPWDMWLPPLFLRGLLFMVALWMASICAMVILRRQWVENEHLIYPLTKVPLAMVQPPPGGSLVAPFFKSGLMWAGLSLSFGRESLNALHHYFPIVPVIPTHFGQLTLIPRFADVGFSVNLMILGFAYFLKADVMFGMWGFLRSAPPRGGCPAPDGSGASGKRCPTMEAAAASGGSSRTRALGR